VLSPSAGDMFFAGRPYARPESLHLLIEEDLGYGPQVGYSQGRGTLRSFAESSVDYFSERYILANVRWAMKKWPIDRARIQCSASTHFAVRHFELFRNLFLGPFALDMDRKWNPGSGSLAGMLGPADSAKTVDGHRAWDSLDLSWFLKKDPGRDIPFMACFFTQPKDGNHGAEYGWQDDPKGLAALRDARQPYLAQWGGASVAREVADGVRSLRWDRSVPAFSRCSLDNNPGNGDCDDGDPWGQINGYLFWDYDDVVDEEGRWAMTVYLVESCPEDACAVDITPRHCSRFRPKPGEKFKWTNKAVKDGSSTAPGAVEADRSGLVTLKQVTVTKGKNRIEIFR
jgi:hypothetical protein